GALHDEVVHDHRDAVDADRVEAAELGGELQLGADAVGARDEDRVLVSLRGLEQAGEATHLRQDLGAQGAARDIPDLVDEALVVFELEAGPGMGVGAAGTIGGARHAPRDRQATAWPQRKPKARSEPQASEARRSGPVSHSRSPRWPSRSAQSGPRGMLSSP